MNLFDFIKVFSNHPKFQELCNLLTNTQSSRYQITGLHGSSLAFLAAYLKKNMAIPQIYILNDKEEASYFYTDLKNLVSEEELLFFPSSYKRSARYNRIENSNIVVRTETLNKIQNLSAHFILVTYPEAIVERVVSAEHLKSNTLHLYKGEKISVDFIVDVLYEYAFERVDFVYEPGQYSVRGSIVDIYSYSAGYPYRIDFFGDEVESIRTFNVENQISIKQLDKISIVPDLKQKIVDSKAVSFFEFIPLNSLLTLKNIEFAKDSIETIYSKAEFTLTPDEEALGFKNLPVEKRLISGNVFLEKIKPFKIAELNKSPFFSPDEKLVFKTSLQPAFKKNFQLLSENLTGNQLDGYRNFIFSENDQQIERLRSIFSQIRSDVEFTAVSPTIHEGFVDHHVQICCYTDHQIFERYHKFQVRGAEIRKDAISWNELTQLQPGDYVVHIDHGVGKFGGLQKIELNGKVQESIKLIYRDNDILFVSIHSLHRISKFKGKDGIPPKIHKLGSAVWQNMKANTKKKVKDIARDLIKLYAQRKLQEGFQFSPDSYLTEELEASFIYEDTPDQVKSTRDVKRDMEASYPMDRLICGDVGFGKTEIAIRAAFKAVVDSKQVAILVPTTILALQHFKTFSERLKDFPCKVEYVSRLRSTHAIKETLKNVASGKTDIIIGTHRILGSDIKFKDLGLLVVDEEQKFGVAAKEKLKKIKLNVDTLTMTATPIPRTLQFSLMGARDLSIINTPPPNRHPIVTELHQFNEEIIREAINYEVERNGQVFIIHNRVQNISEVAFLIQRICPDVSVGVGHGQMKGDELETIMLDFINGDFDVLVATTIIESGLDIPNANTIIINDAHMFGLSDLHQLRGRVGRSNRKAFCYLIAPPLIGLTDEARRRLRAIEDFSELGSGFNISLQDLDIRGAGNMLGGEQSGFIADIGFETYQRILDEAILELKEDEFSELLSEEMENHSGQEPLHFVNDCHIDTDFELLFPDSYISNVSERVKMYRELDNIEDETRLDQFTANLIDRFGPLPSPSLELLDVVRLRWKAVRLGFEKIALKNKKMVAYFVSSPNSPFYKSAVFTKIISFLNSSQGKRCAMQDKGEKLILTIEEVESIKKASHWLKLIEEFNNSFKS